MNLRAKIWPKFLKQILRGEKKIEYRQLETITLIDSKTGREHEFDIESFGICTAHHAKDECPGIKWDSEKSVLMIKLGKELKR